MMSVWTCSSRWKRNAKPRGLAPCGSLSATVGIPAKSEKRSVTGVELRLRCDARVGVVASEESVNVPLSRMPFACAGLNPGWTPPLALSNTAMVSRLSAKSFSSVVSGMARSSVDNPPFYHQGHSPRRLMR
jgi:hypothetical protein